MDLRISQGFLPVHQMNYKIFQMRIKSTSQSPGQGWFLNMNKHVLILFILLPLFAMSQRTLSMAETEGRQEVSMSAVTGKSSDGVYRYYARGESEPFTGILYSKFPNGQYDSWQEYVDGVGQGTWINYYENGNYREVGNYEQNRVEGPVKKYHENGILQAEGAYKDWRIRIGVWKFYDPSGNLLSSDNYGEKGSIVEVREFLERGEISKARYSQILSENGF